MDDTTNYTDNHRSESRNTKSSTRLSRYRTYCFTLNNYSCADVQLLKNLKFKLLVFQSEIGNSGTQHLQGVIKFKDAKTFTAVKKILPAGCHIEKCRNLNASINYCNKQNTWDGQHRFHATDSGININVCEINTQPKVKRSRPPFNEDGSNTPSKEWLKWCGDNFDKWLEMHR